MKLVLVALFALSATPALAGTAFIPSNDTVKTAVSTLIANASGMKLVGDVGKGEKLSDVLVDFIMPIQADSKTYSTCLVVMDTTVLECTLNSYSPAVDETLTYRFSVDLNKKKTDVIIKSIDKTATVSRGGK